MTIDFRIKPPIPAWEGLFAEGRDAISKHFGISGIESTRSETLEQVIAEQDALGITHAVIMGRGNEPGSSNEELAAFLTTQPSKRFIGFIGADGAGVEGAVETIHRYAALGLFHGVSINPAVIQPGVALDDPSWDPIYEAALQHRLPLSITLSVFLGLFGSSPNYDYARPSALVRAAKKYADLKIIISHAGWPFISEAIATAIYCPNIYLSPDVYLGFPGSSLYVEAANFTLSDRLLYGSCYPNVPYEFAIQHFRSHNWNDGVLNKVLFENSAKLLNLV
ncbi:amidohydrolase family protein [Paenibacillus sinopodophylli]|uniref:amidohydrolase family protein n=1 Tax=Paenibacillus sinopodophylli TaxID=1837342 RepID=UPI00110CFF49|nr:amidohydrolase family protein [Paenibacillus sinopodophylli]